MSEIPLFEIPQDQQVVSNVIDSVRRGRSWAKGPFVEKFQRGLETNVGREYAIATNSGTTALVVALRACGIGEGDKVIVPGHTFVATADAVSLVGATPVFADAERETFGLDPDDVRQCLSPDVAAILPVHVYGLPCQIRELAAIADEHDILLVEDAAEAHGATVVDNPVGSFGDVAAFSFCQNKIVACGEGGAVLTDDPGIAEKARQLCGYEGSEGGPAGSNYRLSDVQAAIGCAQLSNIDDYISRRRRLAAEYNERLREVETITVPPNPEGRSHVFQSYTVLLRGQSARDRAAQTLLSRGIDSAVYWDPPTHQYSRYHDTTRPLPVTEALAERVLSLPIYPGMTHTEVEHVVDALVDSTTD